MANLHITTDKGLFYFLSLCWALQELKMYQVCIVTEKIETEVLTGNKYPRNYYNTAP